MSKMVVKASNTTVTIGGAEIGVKNLEFGTDFEEVEAFDTKSEDYLGGKESTPISFSYSKEPDVAKLAENTSLTFSCAISDGTNTSTYTGNIKLLSQKVSISEGGEPIINASGKFISGYTEALTP